MDRFIPVLKRTKLFSGVGEEDISTMLSCLGARLLLYKKGEYVLRQGERLSDILVLTEGNLHIQKDDYWGNRSILGHIAVGEIFGEAYVSPENGTLLNDVIAVEDSSVFFFDVKRVISTCSSACRFHSMVHNKTSCFFAYSIIIFPHLQGMAACKCIVSMVFYFYRKHFREVRYASAGIR